MKGLLDRLSLQTKLLLSFIIIIALATTIGYLFIDHSVRRAFSDFTVRSFTIQDQLLFDLIVGYYRRTGSFDAVIGILDQSERVIPILLVDPSGRVVYAPDERYRGRRLSEKELSMGRPIVLADGSVWTFLPYRTNPARAALEKGFLRTTGRALVLAGLAAAAAGILLSLFLLRHMTMPLRKLDAAAKRIAKGKLDQRVDIETSDEIGRLAASFNEMAESLEMAEEAKRRMIADISHELRTPLTAVRTALDGLRDGLIEPGEETYSAIQNRILLLTRLVSDLHQLALADAGRLSIERRPTRIEGIIDGIVETIGAQLEDSGISLDRSIEADLSEVDVDRQRIEQVLLNLIANAIRHTPEDGKIKISAEREDPDSLLVSICDSGPGIDPSDLPRIFERFYRADEARTSAGGAGLGLPIAKALVEAHGGRIWAENREEGGACFRFTLPIVKNGPPREAAAR